MTSDYIIYESCYCNRAHSTWNRCDQPSFIFSFVEHHISDGFTLYLGNANIQNSSTFFNHGSGYRFRNTRCRNEHISLTSVIGYVGGFRVSKGHSHIEPF